ncbi:thiamine phosphate synthase [Thioalkalivibrio sp. XN279]|uniref:thiamine phosphate synthase n=1 Tax=Thioalkalivibrio sp. XN279 TaxID=2714953 RepID=UPI001408BC7A|nr:thiamine phosphate synthase [Thioalkalivibrio sp. XN279]NHA16121.1 thiamine phosphate synthase [Thioalkalivibrio sp. XN279]
MGRVTLPPGLYAITDPELVPEAVLGQAVAAVVAGGARVVQYRDKTADADTRRRRAGLVLAACRAGGALCIINDDPVLAAALGADGVHLGRDDDDIESARQLLGPERLIGLSCYNEPARAHAAAAAGADYVGVGSVWPSDTKPGAVRAPLTLLGELAATLPVPVVAIGGINRDNAAATIAAGAHAVAVIRDLFADPDPRSAAQVLSAACERGRAQIK